jgi:hypothetical protein
VASLPIPALPLVALALVASGACACTELAPGSDTLLVATGSLGVDDAGAPGDPRWACLDEAPVGGADRLVPSVELELPVRDIVSGQAPEGLSARACAKIDVNCMEPLAAPTGVEVDGAVHLQVPQGFDGYVELTSPLTVPTMYFLNRELRRDASEALNIIGRDTLAALAERGNVALEPALGHLLIRTFDCTGAPASGVQVSNTVGGIPFAFIDGLPIAGADTTSAQGLGGFVNVPLGYAVLQGVLVEGSRLLGTSNVLVREGWLSYGDVEPLPQ